MRWCLSLIGLVMTVSLSACFSQKKALCTLGGGGIGGGLAYSIFDKNPLATGAGSAMGAVLASYFYGQEDELLRESYAEGYMKSASDSLKRQYWLQQEMQKHKVSEGKMSYYSIPGETLTGDGRVLVDHSVTLPILE